MKTDCRLEQFGEWSEAGELVGKSAAVAGLSMPRASGVVGLCTDGAKQSLWHFVVGKKKTN